MAQSDLKNPCQKLDCTFDLLLGSTWLITKLIRTDVQLAPIQKADKGIICCEKVLEDTICHTGQAYYYSIYDWHIWMTKCNFISC